MAYAQKLHEKYPKYFALIDLTMVFGCFISYLWIIPFWFWAIYGLDIAFPQALKDLFFGLWHQEDLARAISIGVVICWFAQSFLMRHDSLKELGIRVDNIYKSGRECAIVTLASVSFMIIVVVVFCFDRCSFEKLLDRSVTWYLTTLSKNAVWGITQQFIMQSLVFVRVLQIFKKRSVSLVTTALLFSLAHSPNIGLMLLTFVLGFICCLLFLRNRNIFTLGMMHGIGSTVLGLLFSLLFVSGLSHHHYNMEVGPYAGDPKLLASIDYKGGPLEAKPSEKMAIPMFVINTSIAPWDSNDKRHPVSTSYHILDAKGDMVEYDNIRTPFGKVIKPGESAMVNLIAYSPSKRGQYYLEVDIVKEQIAWFKDKGLKTIHIPLCVN